MGSVQTESPAPIQRTHSPGLMEVTGFPPRPFLHEHIYLSATIVTTKMATPLSRDSKLSDAHLESLKRREGGGRCH